MTFASSLRKLVHVSLNTPLKDPRPQKTDSPKGGPIPTNVHGDDDLAIVISPDGSVNLVPAGTRAKDVLSSHANLFLSSSTAEFMPLEAELKGGRTYTLHNGLSCRKDQKTHVTRRRSSMSAPRGSGDTTTGGIRNSTPSRLLQSNWHSKKELSSVASKLEPGSSNFYPLFTTEQNLSTTPRRSRRTASSEQLPDVSEGLSSIVDHCDAVSAMPVAAAHTPQRGSISVSKSNNNRPCCNGIPHALESFRPGPYGLQQPSNYGPPRGSPSPFFPCSSTISHSPFPTSSPAALQRSSSRRSSLSLQRPACCCDSCLDARLLGGCTLPPPCSSHLDLWPSGFLEYDRSAGLNPSFVESSASASASAVNLQSLVGADFSLSRGNTFPSFPSDEVRKARDDAFHLEGMRSCFNEAQWKGSWRLPSDAAMQSCLLSPLHAMRTLPALRTCGLNGWSPLEV